MKKFILHAVKFHIALILIISVLPRCSRDEESGPPETENAVDPLPYTGTYRIEPTAGNILLLDETGRATVNDSEGRVLESGRYLTGKATIRIFLADSQKPDAVFLLEDYSPDGWKGRWGEDIKILYRK